MQRDDLMIEYVTLLNLSGHYKEAYDFIMAHRFHPWEGGEGKVTTQYTTSLLELGKAEIAKEHWSEAKEILEKALVYPENLLGKESWKERRTTTSIIISDLQKSISGRTRRRRKSMRQLRSERMNRQE